MKKSLLLYTTAAAFMSTAFFFSGCKDNTANPATQVSSHTFSVNTWYYDSPFHYANLGVSELTSANLNSAGVMVYYSVTPNVWISVPFTVYGTVHDYHMGFAYSPGNVQVTWMYDGTSMGSNPNAYYSTTVKCKVVIVPSSARRANPDVDWDNYDEVRDRFKLAE